MRKQLMACGLLFLGITAPVLSQNNQKEIYPNALFETGKAFFNEKIYEGSIQSLKAFVKESEEESLVAEAEFMMLYAATELNKEGVREEILTYMRDYPVTVHTNRLKYLLASSYYMNGAFTEAIHWFGETDIDQLSSDEQGCFFYRSAYSYLQQKDYEIASNLFKLLKQNSVQYRKDATYYDAYINYCEANYDEALEGFSEVKNVAAYEQDIAFYTMQIKYIQKEYGEAVSLGKNILKTYPQHKSIDEVYRVIGASSFHQGKNSEAITNLTKYKSLNSNPLNNDMYLLGLAYYNQGDYNNAIDNLSKAVNSNDAVAQNAYLLVGQSALKLGDKNKARISFQAASRFDFDKEVKEQAMYNYGLIIHETSFSPFNESLVVFEKFLNLFPNSRYADKVNDYLVDTYLTTKNYDAALLSISKISRPGSKILQAKQNILFQLGAQKFANSDFQTAIQHFNESLKNGDYNPQIKAETYFWRGESYYRLDNFAAAVNDYQSYFSTNRSTDNEYFPLAHYNLAYSYFKQQNITNALTYFNRYIGFTAEKAKPTFSDALNRIGDCYFYQRDWQSADDFYGRALENHPEAGDYSTYQRAFVAGLRKEYNQKITLLDQLIRTYPNSDYLDDAYFEKGRSYVMQEKNSEAIRVFQELMNKFPESSLSRKAGNQIGLLYFNNNNLDEAITAYKKVINKYPGSEEAKVSVEDLKSVYMELDKIDEFASYIRTVDGNGNFNVNEQDSLTYLSAERLFLRGDKTKAQRSLENYLQNFPKGSFSTHAHYYLGNIYLSGNKKQEALQEYKKVVENENKFTEDALVECADITYTGGNYEEALGYFNRLQAKAEKKEHKEASKLGILRCTHLLNRHQEAVVAATAFIDDTKASPEIKQEAYYIRAKSLLALSQEEKAISDLKKIVSETRTVYGAEANFLLANVYFIKNNSAEAEKTIFTFIEKSTPHQYWMARSFILLSDIYIKKGDKFQAKEYLTSLQESYKGKDDIAEMINTRLAKLNNGKKTETNTEQ